MSGIDDRLKRCFASVFPEVPAEELANASTETVPAWDSLAAVTLVAVLEEEFNIQIDLLALPELTSYPAVRSYLEKQTAQ
jgi:acyl carrier protein